MTNEEKILEMLSTLQKDIAKLKEGQNKTNEQLSNLEEGQAEIRSGVNSLLDWAEQVGGSIEFPLPKIM